MMLHFLLPALYSLIFLYTYRSPILFGEFVGGVYIGFGLLFLDRLLHVFYIEGETEFSMMLKDLWRKKDFKNVFRALFLAGTLQERLITRSIYFLIAYTATALFVITSTGSVIGTGIILGIGLHYCFDFYVYQRNLDLLHKHFLWQIKKQFEQQEVHS